VVDAVVLDPDGNSAEVEFVAAEIKRCRPQVPTIVLAKGAGPLRWAPQLADARVKTENVSLLFAALESVLRENASQEEAALRIGPWTSDQLL